LHDENICVSLWLDKFHISGGEEVKKTKFSVAVFIKDDQERILLQRERDGWGLPAGHVEWAEAVEAAAKREVKEETGLEVVLGPGRIGMLVEKIGGQTKRIGLHFKGTIVGGKLRRGKGIKEFYWLSKGKAREFFYRHVMRKDLFGCMQIYDWADIEVPFPPMADEYE